MINLRILTTSAAGLVLLAASLGANDLSKYRQFQLNSDLSEVAGQAQVEVAKAKTIHHRPEMIQELTWPAKYGDSVKEIQFSFYNGQLFRMIVGYDRENTIGLTTGDMVDAISATYGAAVDPAGQLIASSDYDRSKSVSALARWEDSDWSMNLVRFRYDSSFSLVALSKRLDTPAQEAIIEALRLDRVEAPLRESERRKNEEEEKRLRQEKARLANRSDFTP